MTVTMTMTMTVTVMVIRALCCFSLKSLTNICLIEVEGYVICLWLACYQQTRTGWFFFFSPRQIWDTLCDELIFLMFLIVRPETVCRSSSWKKIS